MSIQLKLDWKNESDIDCPRMKKSREFYFVAKYCAEVDFRNTVANRMFYSLFQVMHAIIDRHFREKGFGAIRTISKKKALIQKFEEYYQNWSDEIDTIYWEIYSIRAKGDYYLEHVNVLDIESNLTNFDKLMNEFMRYMKCEMATT